MPAQEITRILTSFEREDATALVNRYGEEAQSIAEEMAGLIGARFNENTPYETLWEQFIADPEGTAPELTGALEALIEADPGFARRLDDMLERYRRITMPMTVSQEHLAGQEQATQQKGAESLSVTGDGRRRTGDFERGAYLYGDTLSGREAVGDGIGHSDVPVIEEPAQRSAEAQMEASLREPPTGDDEVSTASTEGESER